MIERHYYAAEGGHKAIIQLLLATSQVNVDVRDCDGRTRPLFLSPIRTRLPRDKNNSSTSAAMRICQREVLFSAAKCPALQIPHQMMFLRLARRVQRVGVLSLSSLLVGGVVLILFSRNVGSSSDTNLENRSTVDPRQGVFRVGSHLSVQSWLAILGATFGLLSHGLAATYTHLFDWWSSRRAGSADGPGLDYARYLNSQAQAPVMLGLYHGFPVFTLLRYVVVALGIAASLGYKFAVLEVAYFGIEHLPADQVRLQLPPLRAVENGTVSPWVSDGPRVEQNHAFVHHIVYGDDSALWPPQTVTMASWADCSGIFHPLDDGMLVTREVVMFAELEESHSGFSMTSKQGEWIRAESSTGGWFNGSNERAVVDYRIVEPGEVQIQWARRGSWVDDGSGGQQEPIEQRLTYVMRYAVAEMHREVVNNSCSRIYEGSAEFTAISQLPIKMRSTNGSVSVNDRFLLALLYTEGTGPRDGVSAILRGIMTGWGTQLAETAAQDGIPPLGHAPPHSKPFGEENTNLTHYAIATKSSIDYPYYYGDRAAKRTGSYYAAASAFLALGILALVIAVVRVAIGPPVLTSWMGQHVGLALSGAESDGPEVLEDMTSGYQVAGKNLGGLKLVFGDGRTRFKLA